MEVMDMVWFMVDTPVVMVVTQEDMVATLVDMVYPEADITRGLLNQDMEAHMVDTLGDPVEDSQEVMLDTTLDIPVVMVSTQEDIVATQVDMVDITRGLLNQDMVGHMVDTLEDPMEDSQEVMLDPTLDIPVVMVSTQEDIVATQVDIVDITRDLLNQDMEAHMVDTLGDPVEDSQ